MRRKSLTEKHSMENMKKEFEESFELLSEVNEAFHIKMQKIYKKKNMDVDKFCAYTDLHKKFYKDFLSEGYIPRMDTFVSMCMGFGLDLATAESLLASTRFGFDKRNKIHCAYIFLLTHYQGLCIEDCNRILNELGIDEEKHLLGTFYKDDREERKRKKNKEKETL
jgi:hypothetical protein